MNLFYKIIVITLVAFFAVGGFLLLTSKDKAPEGKDLLKITSGYCLADEQVMLFNSKYPDTFLKLTPGCSNAMEILTQIIAGAGPDLIGDLTESNILTYDSAGLFMDLTDIAKTNGVGLDTLADHVRESVTVKYLDRENKLKTKQIAYPTSVQHLFIIYNKSLFDKAGMAYPADDLTWKEYIELAQKLTVRQAGSLAPDVFGAIGVNPLMLIWEFGGAMMNESGTKCTLDSKAVVDAMEFYHKLIHESKAEPIEAQTGMDEQRYRLEQFVAGKVAMLWGSRKMLPELRRAVTLGKGMKIGACLVPRFKDGKRYVNFSVESVAVNPKTKHKKQAIQLLKFLAGKNYAESFRITPNGLSGNKTYWNEVTLSNPSFSWEKDINRIALQSVKYTRMRRRCYFIPATFLMKSFQETRFRIATSPNMTRSDIKQELKKLTQKINTKIQATINREKYSKKLYDTLQ